RSDNGKKIPVIENSDREVEQIFVAECGVAVLHPIVRRQGFIAQIAIFVGVHNRTPDLSVVEDHAVKNRTWILELVVQSPPLFQSCFQVLTFALFRIRRRWVRGFPISHRLLEVSLEWPVLGIPELALPLRESSL